METGGAPICKEFKAGDSLRIGRNLVCDVTVRSPWISGVHCQLETQTANSPIGDEPIIPCSVSFTITDKSSNGTWLLRQHPSQNEPTRVAPDLALGSLMKPRKLRKGITEELSVGDCIFLLAPSHPACKEFQFTLREAEGGSDKYILQQMSTSGADESVGEFNPTEDSSIPTGSAMVHLNASAEAKSSGEKRKLETFEPSGSGTKAPRLVTERTGANDIENKCLGGGELCVDLSGHVATPSDWLENVYSEEGCCPICRKLYPIVELPSHSAACQAPTAFDGSNASSDSTGRGGEAKLCSTTTMVCMEQCPKCLNEFPLMDLINHSEHCTGGSSMEGK